MLPLLSLLFGLAVASAGDVESECPGHADRTPQSVSLLSVSTRRSNSDDTLIDESSIKSPRDLYLYHDASLIQLDSAHKVQTMKEKKRQIMTAMIAQRPHDENSTEYHANAASQHAQVTENNATECKECASAEKVYLSAIEAARAHHVTAQRAAVTLGQAKESYAAAVENVGLAKDWQIGNKTIVDQAEEDYAITAKGAGLADQHAATVKTAEEAACAVFMAAAQVPTQPPTQAPSLSDDSARHPCCLPNSVVRVLYPAGTLPAPASSIRLLIAKQGSYDVSYRGIAIGEQDGDQANMKPGTIASFNEGATVGPVREDTWTEELAYNIEAGKNYLISHFVVVGPDGWVEWDDEGKKVFVRDWESTDSVTVPQWTPARTIENKVYNIKAVQAH